ncbi:MAG: ferrous iron transporter B, partial [Lachnospiraceae bacterium]|nr:ferrous iron transporter B [Lachnospiraceae bacterium]
GSVEHALAHIEEVTLHNLPEDQQRWYAIKLFERDEKVLAQLNLSKDIIDHIENDIKACEEENDDDAESIITNERYVYIASIIKSCYKKKNKGALTSSDKIDKIVTNRWLGLPIFAAIMFLVYWIAMVGVGASATDWANDGLFGDGWHLLGIGTGAYTEDADAFAEASLIVDGYDAYVEENGVAPTGDFSYEIEDEETLEISTALASIKDYNEAVATLKELGDEPDPADYGVWVPGVPVLFENLLNALNVSEEGAGAVVRGLVLEGIVAGVGAVLGFVPQMLVLFLMLAFLEACGYMARIAFVLDRIFRKFGLSGKSFIPMLVGTGCGIPGIMASRTIENERDRRMTIMTTTFIPCGAKVPFIAMIAGAIFGGSAWISTGAYFIGMASITVSGIILKKTKRFSGDPAPFVMELPAYHMPTLKNVLRSMWERGWSFIKKAGTIILLSTIVVWFTSNFGFADGGFGMLEEDQLDMSLLAKIGSAICFIFAPLGFGNWQAIVASITGLVAKENIVGTMGVLYGGEGYLYDTLAATFTSITGFSFLVFNLLCAPCFAAIGAIKREMNNAGWTWFAIGYQCGFAYVIALIINQIGAIFTGNANIFGVIVALALVAGMIYLLVRPYKEAVKLTKEVNIK